MFHCHIGIADDNEKIVVLFLTQIINEVSPHTYVRLNAIGVKFVLDALIR